MCWNKKPLIIAILLSFFLVPKIIYTETYDFDLTYDPKKDLIEGTVLISFQYHEVEDGAYLLLMNNIGLERNPYDNSIVEDMKYRFGFDPSFTEIMKIVDNEENEIEYVYTEMPFIKKLYDYDIENVCIQLKLRPKASYKIKVHFKTHIPHINSADKTAYNGNFFIQRFYWYPSLYTYRDHFVIEPIEFTLKIKIPVGYSFISGFKEKKQNDIYAIMNKKTKSMDIPIIIFPENRYNVLKKKSSNYYVRIFYNPCHETQAINILDNAIDVLDYYAEKYGLLDNEIITIIESPISGIWGTAAEGVITLGSDSFIYSKHLFSLDIYDNIIEGLVAHEIGHFYFGISTSPDFILENYLSESITQYISIEYIEHKYGQEDNLWGSNNMLLFLFLNLFDYYPTSYKESLVNRFSLLRKSGFDFEIISDLEDQNINGLTDVIYQKGAMAIRQVATEVGKESFAQALSEYFIKYKHQVVNSQKAFSILKTYDKNIEPKLKTILQTTNYPDFAITDIKSSDHSTKIVIRDLNETGLSSNVLIKTSENYNTFKVNGRDEIEVTGNLEFIEIDPEWYTLDINRKNNYYPGKLNVIIPFNSKYEADLLSVSIDLRSRMMQDGNSYLNLWTGLLFQSEDLISYTLDIGSIELFNFMDQIPFEFYGAYGNVLFELPGFTGISAEYAYYMDNTWELFLLYDQSLLFKKHTGSVIDFYFPQFLFAFGVGLDQMLTVSPFFGIYSLGIRDFLPYYFELYVFSEIYTMDIGYSVVLDGSFSPIFRIIPRLYFIPTINGAYGISSIYDIIVPSRLRIPIDEYGRYRLYGGVDLLFPIVNEINLSIFNFLIFRSISTSLYFETEDLFDSIPDIMDSEYHAGIEFGLKFTTHGNYILPIAFGVDVDLRDVTHIDSYGFYISTNVPIIMYTSYLSY